MQLLGELPPLFFHGGKCGCLIETEYREGMECNRVILPYRRWGMTLFSLCLTVRGFEWGEPLGGSVVITRNDRRGIWLPWCGRGNIDDTRRTVPALLFGGQGGYMCHSKGDMDVIGRAWSPVARYTGDTFDFVDLLDNVIHTNSPQRQKRWRKGYKDNTITAVQSDMTASHELQQSFEKVKEKIEGGHWERGRLKDFLDQLYRTFDIQSFSPDPLEIVRRFEDPRDREIVGIIASSLAYGRVERILFSVERVLSVMGGSPYAFVMQFNPVRDTERFEGFVHRFNRGVDIACLLFFLRQAVDLYGSLETMFADGYYEEDRDTGKAIARFVGRFLGYDCSPLYREGVLPADAGVRFFLPSPADGSACKRLNLFLRWMVRHGRDGLDLGVWKAIPPSKLIMPVDTHVARLARDLGLTERKQADWKMAIEITECFREFDSDDPLRYDFALCHWGMMEQKKRQVDGEEGEEGHDRCSST